MRSLVSSACLLLFVSVLSACSGSGGGECGERLDSDIGSLSTQAWVELMSPAGLPTDATGTTEVYALDVSTVLPGAHSAKLILDDQIALYGSFVAQIHDAFRRGDQVFLALYTQGRSDSLVQYIVFRHADGTHDFAQQCFMSDVQASIEAAYGSEADAKLDQLIGTTGAAQTKKLFSRLQ